MASSLIDVVEVIERQNVGAGQCLVVLLCALLMFLDGFDTQAISYIVPALSSDWHLSREILGSIFSAALVGLMVGSTFWLEDQGEARASVAALGIGRLGGIAGPLIAGMLYCAHWTPVDIFRFSAWPVLVAGIGVFVMGRIYGSRPVVVETSATH
ncbi:hypothetical protein PQQ86_07335 [Paraburkholderia sediminicola]|uniref:hypothetical protein n=1 Tax=Paraburkholderia sediminicola TaxID=458836 RepID=UPI0038B7DCAF